MTTASLRRYTDLAAALRMLRQKSITLLPPNTWDDKNDRHLMQAYQAAEGYKSVLALCFAQAAETYHHWKVFSSGKDGICIVFDKQRLVSDISQHEVRHASVQYYTLKQLRENRPNIERIPYSKRAAYVDEKEYRFVFCSKLEELASKDFAFSRASVDRILINPWMPIPLVQTIKDIIHSLPEFDTVEILQSTVIDGPAWKELAEQVRNG